VINPSDKDLEQPLDEDAQGNVLVMRQIKINGVDNNNQMTNKQDVKPATEEEEQATPPSPE
jgi:hypothetical protein